MPDVMVAARAIGEPPKSPTAVEDNRKRRDKRACHRASVMVAPRIAASATVYGRGDRTVMTNRGSGAGYLSWDKSARV
jgi:hypothetical protein